MIYQDKSTIKLVQIIHKWTAKTPNFTVATKFKTTCLSVWLLNKFGRDSLKVYLYKLITRSACLLEMLLCFQGQTSVAPSWVPTRPNSSGARDLWLICWRWSARDRGETAGFGTRTTQIIAMAGLWKNRTDEEMNKSDIRLRWNIYSTGTLLGRLYFRGAPPRLPLWTSRHCSVVPIKTQFSTYWLWGQFLGAGGLQMNCYWLSSMLRWRCMRDKVLLG